MRKHALGLGLSMWVVLVAVPNTANATVVQCGNQSDSCQVSNEGSDFVSCTCIGEGTEGEEWMDFGEAELIEICESYLMHCNGEGTGDADADGESTTEDPGCGESDDEGIADGTGEGGEPDGGDVDGGEGGGCSVDEGSGVGLAATLGLLGMFGLRRRQSAKLTHRS